MPIDRKCSTCGETDPYPGWFCLAKMAGEARQGQPCQWSVEGNRRLGSTARAPEQSADQTDSANRLPSQK